MYEQLSIIYSTQSFLKELKVCQFHQITKSKVYQIGQTWITDDDRRFWRSNSYRLKNDLLRLWVEQGMVIRTVQDHIRSQGFPEGHTSDFFGHEETFCARMTAYCVHIICQVMSEWLQATHEWAQNHKKIFDIDLLIGVFYVGSQKRAITLFQYRLFWGHEV